MMECPRCGFVQPEDKYCANCGLDVETYQQIPPPLAQRLMKNSNFHLGLIASLIGLIGLYIYNSHRQQITASVQAFLENPSIPAATNETTPSTAPAEAKPHATSSERSATTRSNSEAPSNEAQAAAEAAALAKITGEGNDETVKQPTFIEVSFYEVPRETVTAALADAQVLNESAFSKAALVTNRERITNLIAGGRRLPGQKQSAFKADSQLEVHYGGQPSGAASADSVAAFSFALQISKVEGTSCTTRVAGAWQVPDAEAKAMVNGNYEASMNLPFAATLVITGLVTPRAFSTEARSEIVNSPLAVLLSEEFQSNDTDFVTIIRFSN